LNINYIFLRLPVAVAALPHSKKAKVKAHLQCGKIQRRKRGGKAGKSSQQLGDNNKAAVTAIWPSISARTPGKMLAFRGY